MNLNSMKTRQFVSFDGACPYHCKHCYIFDLKLAERLRSADEIADDLEGKQFDVVYVSHNKENFVIPAEGIDLCEKIFERYECNLMIITRNTFDQNHLDRLNILNQKMKKRGKLLFLAVSLPALDSISITEGEETIIPTPEKRMKFLKNAKQTGLLTILVIRPLYPEKIIPIEEPLEIIDSCKDYVDCVLSSGLAVNDKILSRLGLNEKTFEYVEDKLNEYLAGAIEGDVKYIDVENELKKLERKCKHLGLPFFEHSMFALNYLASRY